MTTNHYTPSLITSMKRMARSTVLWYGSHADDMLADVRNYAFTPSFVLAAKPFEEIKFTETITTLISKLLLVEPERTVRMLVEVINPLDVVDAELYRAFMHGLSQKTNLLQHSKRMLGNLDAKYLLASTILFYARNVLSSEQIYCLKAISNEPWDYYATKNNQLIEDINNALKSLGIASVSSETPLDTYHKEVAISLFGPAWAESHSLPRLLPVDIIREVIRQRPAFANI